MEESGTALFNLDLKDGLLSASVLNDDDEACTTIWDINTGNMVYCTV